MAGADGSELGSGEPPLVKLLGIRLLEQSEGRAVLGGQVTEQVCNMIGTAHGGFLATLLDAAMFCAVNAGRSAGAGLFATVDLGVTFVRPLRREVGEVRCEARV